MKIEVNTHERCMLDFANKHPETLVLSADLGTSCEVKKFRAEKPDQYLTMGIAEQNMCSWAAGLAREGYRPFLHTFSVFLSRRILDQVEMSVAYPNLPVTFVGFVPGITTPGGVTHQSINDVGIMRTVPNMAIFDVGDATDIEGVLDLVYEWNGALAKWDQITGFPLILAISLFSIQMYLDWMGCMDIAHGVSEIFGINLDKNFWHPFFSKNMPEFWRRWHISLGAWFKDYLLYPVSMSALCKKINKFTRKKWGNQVSRSLSVVIPASCVWIVTGVWHGAASCFVLWGIYHGILIVSSGLFEIPIQKLCKFLHMDTECFSFNLFRMARTFMLSTIGRIFFAVSAGFTTFFEFLKRMFNFRQFGLHTLLDESLYSYGLDQHNFTLAMLLVALVWGVSMLQEKFNKDGMTIRDVIAKQNILFRWLLYLALIAGILVFGMYGSGYNAGAFFYGKF